jgi:hypothetical protein
MSPTESVAFDPSVADYRATSPFEWLSHSHIFSCGLE